MSAEGKLVECATTYIIGDTILIHSDLYVREISSTEFIHGHGKLYFRAKRQMFSLTLYMNIPFCCVLLNIDLGTAKHKALV